MCEDQESCFTCGVQKQKAGENDIYSGNSKLLCFAFKSNISGNTNVNSHCGLPRNTKTTFFVKC